MDPAVLRAIISQGGFAVLAFVVIYLGFLGNKRWVDDIKAAGDRERELTGKVFDLARDVTTQLAGNTAAIVGLTAEVAGLRAIAHNIANFQGQYSLDKVDLTRRIDTLERRP